VEGIGLVIAESPAMIELLREALILHAEPSVSVLIEGETGTGKEVMARYIHHGEAIVDTPFMAINCAAIPHELFESELFGHEQGAFTGSRAEGAPGKLEQAGKGTLFLDEVAEMPLSLQPKLLRVLEERSFYRVGGVKKRSFDARIVCAGNRNMADMVEKGTFRRDLYHRLRVGHVCIPPLRERPEDIIALAGHFLRREASRKRKQFQGFADETLDILRSFPWPGNVRELENTIERAVLMHDGELLLPRHVTFLYQGIAPGFVTPRDAGAGLGDDTFAVSPLARGALLASLSGHGSVDSEKFDVSNPDSLILPEHPLHLDELVEAVVQAALRRFDGNKTKAADYLGISRFALHRKLQSKNEKRVNPRSNM
jgi:Transcriptional regulator containing PAS, AAA-type ATPase, and DNA-binding domains